MTTGTFLENRYRIRGVLGEGGMSRVYLADDLRLKMPVAIKENLQTSEESRRQFAQEAEILARLPHPNLPRVIDHFEDARTGQQYLVMDYIEGEDLDSMIRRVGPLAEAMALAWIQQILSAVEYLHSQKPPVIHRDIKPANIKITPQGKAVLVDFGIAKIYDPRIATLTGARAVTPGYAAPEQYGMKTDERSDVYSLGATLYTMLTGRVPPEAPLRVSGEKLIPPRQITRGQASPSTERMVLQAMELETSKRWQSAPQMRAALERQDSAPETLEGRTVYVGKPTAQNVRGLNMPLVIGAAIGIGVICLLTVLLLFSGESAKLVALLTTFTPTPTMTITPNPTRTSTLTPTSTPTPPPTTTPILGIGSSKISPIDGAPMMFVPAGEYLMGSSDQDIDTILQSCTVCKREWYAHEQPQHPVYLDVFWINKFEVTNAQYAKCVNVGKCSAPSQSKSYTRNSYYGNSAFDTYPVIYVSWNDANTYCAWAGKRLPTEAEWEKAARGTDGRIYPWGNTWDGTKLNSMEDSRGVVADTTAVGSYPIGASPYGVIDMAGNVSEWVVDWYTETYYSNSPYAASRTGCSSRRVENAICSAFTYSFVFNAK